VAKLVRTYNVAKIVEIHVEEILSHLSPYKKMIQQFVLSHMLMVEKEDFHFF